MDSNDWRAQLPADARQRIVNKIINTLKLHLPSSGHEGVQELRKIVMRFEEKIFSSATSEVGYLRRMSLKMHTIESKSNPSSSNAAGMSRNPQDPGSFVLNEPSTSFASVGLSTDSNDWRAQIPADARQRIVTKIMDTLKLHLPSSDHEGVQELRKIAMRFEDKMFHAATSRADYLRRISLKMLTMESKSNPPGPMPNPVCKT